MGKPAKGVGEWEPLGRTLDMWLARGHGERDQGDGGMVALSGQVRPRPHQVLLAPGSAYTSYAYLRSRCSVFLPPGISVQTEEGREEV